MLSEERRKQFLCFAVCRDFSRTELEEARPVCGVGVIAAPANAPPPLIFSVVNLRDAGDLDRWNQLVRIWDARSPREVGCLLLSKSFVFSKDVFPHLHEIFRCLFETDLMFFRLAAFAVAEQDDGVDVP